LLILAPASGTVSASEQRQVIRLTASQYQFDPGIIRVQKGQQVTLDLHSVDVVHGIYIDGYELQTEFEPGKAGRLSFTADQSGTFRIRCSVTCGALHPFMIGQLQVDPGLRFSRIMGSVLLAAAAGLLWRKTV
jgi:heme/copper-type cytochrome/quinol oxidase subunit 2